MLRVGYGYTVKIRLYIHMAKVLLCNLLELS